MQESNGRLAGKVSLIMGGARGIGRGIAERCAAEGARVVIADRSEERDAAAAAIGATAASVLALPLDVRTGADHERVVRETATRFGRVDALVYCAGIFPRAGLLETDDDLWRRVLDTNLTGAFLACRATVPVMRAQGGGAIVAIGSLHANRGSPELFAYAVSKGGLVTLVRNLAGGLAPDRIRVNCVHPGWVLSEGEQAIRGLEASQSESFAQEAARRIPLGRMQTPGDIAGTVAYLLSEDAAQVTGQIIAVDGGLGMQGLR